VTFRTARAQAEVMNNEQANGRSALAGDHARFNEIYARYGKQIQAYCARRTSSPLVADAVAETFLVAWRRLDQIEDVNTALPWLYGTAYRVISHQWRSRSRAQQLMKRLVDSDESEQWAPEVIVMRRQESDLVLLAAKRLRPVDQEILRLTIWEGTQPCGGWSSALHSAQRGETARLSRPPQPHTGIQPADPRRPIAGYRTERYLVSSEEQVVALFAAANPIPDADLVEPLEPFDASFLEGFAKGSEARVVIRPTEWVDRGTSRGLRPVLAAMLAVALIAVGIAVGVRFLAPRTPPVLGQPRLDLGVFEPVRGWIVYGSGEELEALDPADPSRRHTLEFPEGLGVSYLMAAGWSRDGSFLAISDEYNGGSYVMDRSGSVTSLSAQSGCCWFVTSNWLSPDGLAYLRFGEEGNLETVSVGDPGDVRILVAEENSLEQLDSQIPAIPAWSPDGSAIAFVSREENGFFAPKVEVVSVDGGDRRVVLVGPEFGHVRHLSWSPDGSQLLVIAGDSTNHLLAGQATRLYLVNADGSGSRALEPDSLTERSYVAGSWSPDGVQVSVIDYPGRDIVIMNTDGSDRRVLAHVRVIEPFISIAWHPAP
jgi:DNA-directed RNA polymerase specialized sigma24 family protein